MYAGMLHDSADMVTVLPRRCRSTVPAVATVEICGDCPGWGEQGQINFKLIIFVHFSFAADKRPCKILALVTELALPSECKRGRELLRHRTFECQNAFCFGD